MLFSLFYASCLPDFSFFCAFRLVLGTKLRPVYRLTHAQLLDSTKTSTHAEREIYGEEEDIE
jgi:hypothetical protein